MNINSTLPPVALLPMQHSASQAPQRTAATSQASEEASESAQMRAQEASKRGGIDTYA